MRCLIAASLLAILAGPALTGPALAEGPSFDCAQAATDVEKAICADPALSAADAELAKLYTSLLKRLDAPAAKALEADQRAFLRARDQAYGLPDEDLGSRLRDRIGFLETIGATPPRRDLAGSWANLYGQVEVTKEANGDLAVSIQTADPVSARWICDVSGLGHPADGKLEVQADVEGTDDGWTLAVARDGGLLTLDELAPTEDADGIRPYCGANGFVGGDYFPFARQQ